MTRTRKPAKESKRDAFVRVGEQRMKVLIKALRMLGNLSNRNAYEFTQDDVDRMATALCEEIAEFKARMENKKRSSGFSFTAPDPNQLDMLGKDNGTGEQKAA